MKYRIELNKERQTDEFAVCLTIAPNLPGKSAKHVEGMDGHNVGVVGANDDNPCGGWGWCNFSSDEKEAIGEALIDVRAVFNEWFYCTMYEVQS